MEFDEVKLIERAQAGDKDAIRQLLQHHYVPLAQALRSWGCAPHELDDLVHDTFVRVLQAMPRFENRGSFAAWLRRIGLNLLRDHARRAVREKPIEPEMLERAQSGQEATYTNPDDKEFDVIDLLNVLPLEQRVVLILRFFEDKSLKEIARIVQSPVGTVKSRLHYGLRRLRELVDSREIEEARVSDEQAELR